MLAHKPKMDAVINFVVTLAQKQLHPRTIILFGSRARGDHQPTSDYDLAFELGDKSKDAWSRFVLDVQDHAPTLKTIDLVALHMADAPLKKRISTEGVVVYAES